MKTVVKPTKEQLKQDLNLSELPSDRFMELLELVGDDSRHVVTPRDQGTSEEWTPTQIEDAVNEMVLAKSVGDLLAEARKQSGMTMNEVAEKMSVTKGRVNQLEHPEASLEVATVARMAQAMGYKLTLTLDPKTPDKHPLKVELI